MLTVVRAAVQQTHLSLCELWQPPADVRCWSPRSLSACSSSLGWTAALASASLRLVGAGVCPRTPDPAAGSWNPRPPPAQVEPPAPPSPWQQPPQLTPRLTPSPWQPAVRDGGEESYESRRGRTGERRWRQAITRCQRIHRWYFR